MFNPDFYPTPVDVIEEMLFDTPIRGKVFLEPSAGKGNIVDYLKQQGAADVVACENDENLLKILQTKCNVIEKDFLKLEAHKISHINCIVMNPPFSNAATHILHAYNIAPAGCKIVSLCNEEMFKNSYSKQRQELKTIIENYGSFRSLGQNFTDAERKTNVVTGLVIINKAGTNENAEFDGFFLEDEEEVQSYGIMPYNFVRELVNRYVAAIKIFDKQLETAAEMNKLTSTFFSSTLSISVTEEGKPKLRNDFKKDLQKSAWNFIFEKMNMKKYSTQSLKADINKFVEEQQHIPFTMRNIYRMLDIVIGTQGQRMDKALMEAFDLITKYHHDNRFNVEGWKTNSHFLVTEKFVLPYCAETNFRGGATIVYGRYDELNDITKALCYLTGKNFDEVGSSWNINDLEWGEWSDYGFFEIKPYKKGTMHFKFKDEKVWHQFNQRIAKLKGYPLYEPKTQTAYQDRQTGRAKQSKANMYRPTQKVA